MQFMVNGCTDNLLRGLKIIKMGGVILNIVKQTMASFICSDNL